LGLNIKKGVESLCDLCDVALKLLHSGLSLGEIWEVGSHGLLQNRGMEGKQKGSEVTKQLLKILRRPLYAGLLAWVP
jgi:hypothetical protein